MEKLTFKQYLDSKDQLIKAMDNIPIAIQEYEVRNYCSLTVGEAEDDKQIISLKPKTKVIVEWQYYNIDHPTPLSVKIVGALDIDEEEQFDTFWTDVKLKKWLSCHTKEVQST